MSADLRKKMPSAYLSFRDDRVRSPSPIPEKSYDVCVADLAEMIIRAMTVVALVTAAVWIDDDALTDSEAGDFRAEFVDGAYELVSERHWSVLLARKRSLEERKRAAKSPTYVQRNACTSRQVI